MRTALQFTSLLTLPVFVLVSFSEYLICAHSLGKKKEQEREKERNKERKKENSKETRN